MNYRKWLTGLILLGVMAVAVAFRFYDIKQYPAGLFPDQAANGEDALLILHGDMRPFYERGNGREALFFYVQAAFIKEFGIGVWPMFAASALIGTLTVLAIYYATRVYFGRLSGLLASFFLATSYWHTTISRTGFRAIMAPLFIALFTAWTGYTVRAVKKGDYILASFYASLAGIAFSAGFYTYISYRVMVGVVIGVIIFLLLAALHPKIGFPHFRRYRSQLLVSVLFAFVVIAPLGWYFIQHPNAFMGRAGQVSVFSVDLQRQYGGGELLPTILYSTRETILSFFVGHGDLNWRQNVVGYPLLNPLVGSLFLLGLVWAILGLIQICRSIFRGEEIHMGMIYPYLLLLLSGLLVPVIMTAEGIPHGLRSIGLSVPIFILAGTAGAVCIRWLLKWQRRRPYLMSGIVGGVAGILLLSGLYDGSLYFLIARNSSEAYAAYRGDLTDVAAYLNKFHQDHAQNPRPYLVLDRFSLQTIHYLTSVSAHNPTDDPKLDPDEAQHKWRQLDPGKPWPDLEAGSVVVFTQSTMPDADQFHIDHPQSPMLETRTNRFGQEIMRVYLIEKSPTEGSSLDA